VNRPLSLSRQLRALRSVAAEYRIQEVAVVSQVFVFLRLRRRPHELEYSRAAATAASREGFPLPQDSVMSGPVSLMGHAVQPGLPNHFACALHNPSFDVRQSSFLARLLEWHTRAKVCCLSLLALLRNQAQQARFTAQVCGL
jgi:hypothetical protein